MGVASIWLHHVAPVGRDDLGGDKVLHPQHIWNLAEKTHRNWDRGMNGRRLASTKRMAASASNKPTLHGVVGSWHWLPAISSARTFQLCDSQSAELLQHGFPWNRGTASYATLRHAMPSYAKLPMRRSMLWRTEQLHVGPRSPHRLGKRPIYPWNSWNSRKWQKNAKEVDMI